MCGRYSLALRPAQVRAYLQNVHMQVDDAPEDDADDAPRQSYNFAPGYNGLVYRADVPYYGAGSKSHKDSEGEDEPLTEAQDGADEHVTQEDQDQEASVSEVKYKLQTMRWGLIPFWTKRNPDYGSMLKTINCRSDSLLENRGMWTSMKGKKRCVVVCQGFYEWLKKGKEKIPHYVRRKDGALMCMAGLWDCVQYEGSEEKVWTYTIITTDSNAQLNFLHDRMPVILENGSEGLKTWLDPKRTAWSKELQALLRPFEGELDIYAVSKDVGKVGNNSPTFIVPVASAENKSNIANFFAKGTPKKDASSTSSQKSRDTENEDGKTEPAAPIKQDPDEDRKTVDHEGTEDNAPLPIPKTETKQGIKRELDDVPDDEHPRKVVKTSTSPSKPKPAGRSKNPKSNNTASPKKTAPKEKGSQKITSFFGK